MLRLGDHGVAYWWVFRWEDSETELPLEKVGVMLYCGTLLFLDPEDFFMWEDHEDI